MIRWSLQWKYVWLHFYLSVDYSEIEENFRRSKSQSLYLPKLSFVDVNINVTHALFNILNTKTELDKSSSLARYENMSAGCRRVKRFVLRYCFECNNWIVFSISSKSSSSVSILDSFEYWGSSRGLSGSFY